jgi:hypothetical protein
MERDFFQLIENDAVHSARTKAANLFCRPEQLDKVLEYK